MENEYEMPSVTSMAIKWGLIMGILNIFVFLGIAISGIQAESWAGGISVIPTLIIIYLAHAEFKENGDGYMSYSKGLGIGTAIVAVSSNIYSIFTYIYIKYIDLTYTDVLREAQITAYQDQGLSDEEIETALKFSEMFMKPETMFVMGIIGGIFFGFILSLIMSAFTKNSNPALEV